ncbi:ADP-ribosylation factor protein 3 [Thecaphora frezii]
MYHLLSGLYAEWTKKERFNILILGLAGVGKSCLLEKIKSIYLRVPALPPQRIAPTVGQNVFTLTLPSTHLHFWDLGGSASVRSLWASYYQESHALVFVVDARDFLDLDLDAPRSLDKSDKGKGKAQEAPEQSERAQRRDEVWRTLAPLLEHPELQGVPVLVVANRVDEVQTEQVAALPKRVERWLKGCLDASLAQAEAEGGGEGGEAERQQARETTALVQTGYEWDVVATSAMDGTGVHDAVDWLYLRVQNVKR